MVHPIIVMVIGLVTVIVSIISPVTQKMSLFILVGIGMILWGVIQLFLRKPKQKAQQNRVSSVHSNQSYTQHHRQQHQGHHQTHKGHQPMASNAHQHAGHNQPQHAGQTHQHVHHNQKHCPNCRKVFAPHYRFCPHCGYGV